MMNEMGAISPTTGRNEKAAKNTLIYFRSADCFLFFMYQNDRIGSATTNLLNLVLKQYPLLSYCTLRHR